MLTAEEKRIEGIEALISSNAAIRQELFSDYTKEVVRYRRVTAEMETSAAVIMKCFKKKQKFGWIHRPIQDAIDIDANLLDGPLFRKWMSLVSFKQVAPRRGLKQ